MVMESGVSDEEDDKILDDLRNREETRKIKASTVRCNENKTNDCEAVRSNTLSLIPYL